MSVISGVRDKDKQCPYFLFYFSAFCDSVQDYFFGETHTVPWRIATWILYIEKLFLLVSNICNLVKTITFGK